MSSKSLDIYLWWKILSITLLLITSHQTYGLNLDGVLLLSFKFNILHDPLEKLVNWNIQDETPCSWNGVICGTPSMYEAFNRVISFTLPNSMLLGSIPANLGMIQHLRFLDISNNSINGSIPFSIFHASELQSLDLSYNIISGEIPEFVGGLKNLQLLNLSDNALSGQIPENLTTLHNLTVISLKNNYFFGAIPRGFDSVQVLDLSSNLFNGSLPPNIGGNNISYLNVSFNRISGEIPKEFGEKFPPSAMLDLSFNNLTGEIPESVIFLKQDSRSFIGNQDLCGIPIRNPCPIPSSMSTLPNASEPTSPPAIAAIPKTIDSTPGDLSNSPSSNSSNGPKPIIIIVIVVANVALLAFFILVFVCFYHYKKKIEGNIKKEAESAKAFDWASSSGSTKEYTWLRIWTCLVKQKHEDDDDETSSNSDTEDTNEIINQSNQSQQPHDEQKKGELVIIDGENELELDTLLKASAYILGASGSSIMYKAVLEDGGVVAVRRIGESGVGIFRDFENQVKVIAKLVHPNLVKIRGFYSGVEEKLVIYDFVPNGSLANARYRKPGTSPCHLPWDARLKIAKGVARGLSYIHDKKHVHGNLKPSNILLNQDMEPKVGDFGLERLVMGDNSSKTGWSARDLGSKRSTTSMDSFREFNFGPSPSGFSVSPYHAPESFRSLKPNPKWDVFSFGVVLLELLTGKVIVSDDMGPDLTIGSANLDVEEERNRVLRMADMMIRGDIEGKEEAFLNIIRIGYNCISPVPQKRPSMKEVLQALEKFPSSCSISTSFYFGN
ncbi:hypothetical protein LIER_00370 [Lithospermum erythrorhizon]|uniref:non-specific serine/threonine protein kinase n=1 Tax=Lithospermum erythrorhizon TaxID=34254 RepID=A0AAV3NH65_LITER